MSADNYYMIRKHPSGGYVALMGFASDERTPTFRRAYSTYTIHDTVDAAVESVINEYTEYGIQVHKECETP